MADPELPLPLEIPWRLASTTLPLTAAEPDQTSISLFVFTPDDANVTARFPDERLVFLKFTVSVSPATIPGSVPAGLLGEGVPCFHLLLDLKVRKKNGDLGTIRPYFHAASPIHRTMVQSGIVGADTFEGEADEQSVGRSGSQMHEASSSRARTTSASLSAGIGIGPVSIGGSIRTTSTTVSGSRDVSQQIDTTERLASQERRELLSHMTRVENVLTLLNAKYVGTPYLSFSMNPQPLQLLTLDPADPNLWFSQLLSRRSSGIEGVQDFTVILLVPKGQDFCVSARLRRVCVLDNPPGPLTFDEPFRFNQHLGRLLQYLDRVYPIGTPLEELDVDLTGSLPTPQEFPRPVINNWIVSAAGYMIADVVSPPRGPSPLNVRRAEVAYKHLLEIWLEVLRDEYEREVARSPLERGVLLGENRTLDTCFTFAETLAVASSNATVTPLARIVVDPAFVDLGGVRADASRARDSVRDRAYETATRWNLLENRLAVLLANRRTVPTKKINFGDDALLTLIIDRAAKLRADDPQNVPIDAAAKLLGLSDAQRKTFEGAGAIDLRTLARVLRASPEIDAYNARLDLLRETYKSEKTQVQLPDPIPSPIPVRERDGIRKSMVAALAKLSPPDSAKS